MTENFYNFLQKERQRVQNDLVIKTSQGHRVFGHYELVDHSKTATVWVFKDNEFICEFSSNKSALAWCTADKFRQWALATTIQNLDRDYLRINYELIIGKLQIQQSQRNRDLLVSKISTKISVLENIKNQMKKSIDQAKYLQTRGFYYET